MLSVCGYTMVYVTQTHRLIWNTWVRSSTLEQGLEYFINSGVSNMTNTRIGYEFSSLSSIVDLSEH